PRTKHKLLRNFSPGEKSVPSRLHTNVATKLWVCTRKSSTIEHKSIIGPSPKTRTSSRGQRPIMSVLFNCRKNGQARKSRRITRRDSCRRRRPLLEHAHAPEFLVARFEQLF